MATVAQTSKASMSLISTHATSDEETLEEVILERN